MVKIAPSILSADFSRLADEVKKVELAGADLIHVDVMDGHFVPNITIGQPVVKSLRKATKLPLDVHLMIEEPDLYAKEFAQAGSDIITVHPEADIDLDWTINALKELGVKTGVALKPSTPVESIKSALPELDVVMIMSVEPGFGGQKFMHSSLDKIAWLKKHFKGEIEIDGGITVETAPLAAKAGATILVAGNSIFSTPDPGNAVKELKRVAGKR